MFKPQGSKREKKVVAYSPEITVFVKGLSEEPKDEFATQDEPETLEGLTVLAIGIDDRLRKSSKESSSHYSSLPFPPVYHSVNPKPCPKHSQN